jgi:hypothetical protein
MEADFLPVLIQKKHRVYGFDLKPYSILHSFFLDALESPFYRGTRLPAPSDTLIAAAICSQDWPDLESLSFSPWRRWIHRDPAREAQKLFRYLHTNNSFPEYIDRGGSNTMELGTPHQLRMVVSLVGMGLCKNWGEAWRFPYVSASWAMAAYRENLIGKAAIETDEARNARAEHNATKDLPPPDWVAEMAEKLKKKAGLK